MLAIDAKRTPGEKNKWHVTIKAGSEPTDIDAIEWAVKPEKLGAGEILLTSMDADGTKTGYDIELTAAIADAVSIPVIASGGAGTLDSLVDVLKRGKADAVLAASNYHYKEYSIKDVKQYLAQNDISIRPVK